ncbi:MAG TPA: type II secretion system protein [Candidatus Wallbacteria bacterium]|nr:type II secretion system protein [Candidatus Wallbacteria bacterium]
MIIFKFFLNSIKNSNIKKCARGLSLLEALLTMTIVTIAVSVVLPVSKIYIVSQREETLKKNLQEIREAIDKYKKEKSHYPYSIDELLENRYLRRVEAEPFGNRWQYKPHTGPHEWKDFEVQILTDKPYLAAVKNISMKAKKYTVVYKYDGTKGDTTESEPLSVEKGSKDEPKKKDIGGGAYEVELYEEIFDIRTSTDYTGINGVPYNQW